MSFAINIGTLSFGILDPYSVIYGSSLTHGDNSDDQYEWVWIILAILFFFLLIAALVLCVVWYKNQGQANQLDQQQLQMSSSSLNSSSALPTSRLSFSLIQNQRQVNPSVVEVARSALSKQAIELKQQDDYAEQEWIQAREQHQRNLKHNERREKEYNQYPSVIEVYRDVQTGQILHSESRPHLTRQLPFTKGDKNDTDDSRVTGEIEHQLRFDKLRQTLLRKEDELSSSATRSITSSKEESHQVVSLFHPTIPQTIEQALANQPSVQLHQLQHLILTPEQTQEQARHMDHSLKCFRSIHPDNHDIGMFTSLSMRGIHSLPNQNTKRNLHQQQVHEDDLVSSLRAWLIHNEEQQQRRRYHRHNQQQKVIGNQGTTKGEGEEDHIDGDSINNKSIVPARIDGLGKVVINNGDTRECTIQLYDPGVFQRYVDASPTNVFADSTLSFSSATPSTTSRTLVPSTSSNVLNLSRDCCGTIPMSWNIATFRNITSWSKLLTNPINVNTPILVELKDNQIVVFPYNFYMDQLLTVLEYNNNSPPTSDVLAGWVLQNISLTSQSIIPLATLQAAIMDQPLCTTDLEIYLNKISIEYERQRMLVASRIELTSIQSLKQNGSQLVNLATSATTNTNNLSTLEQLYAVFTQTYSVRMSTVVEPAINRIRDVVREFNNILNRVLLATVLTEIPSTANLQDFATSWIDQVSDDLSIIKSAIVGGEDDFDLDIEQDGLSSQQGLLSLWRTIMGGNEPLINTATINGIWCQYLYLESILVAGIILQAEYQHLFSIPTATTQQLLQDNITFINRLRSVFCPGMPPIYENVFVVFPEEQLRVIEFNARSGTIWLLDSPSSLSFPSSIATVSQYWPLFDLQSAIVAVSLINVQGITNWNLPNPDHVMELLSLKGSWNRLTQYGITADSSSTSSTSSTSPITPTNDLDFLRMLGLSGQYTPLLPGVGADVRFWTSILMLLIVPPQSTTPTYTTPIGYANVFSVHSYPVDGF